MCASPVPKRARSSRAPLSIGERRAAEREDSCCLTHFSRSQLGKGDAMNAPNPAREMTLVGEAGLGGDFGEAGSAFPDKLDRPLQAQVHDIAMWRQADASRKDPRKVEGAACRNAGERRNLDRLVQMGHHIVADAIEHVPAEHAT